MLRKLVPIAPFLSLALLFACAGTPVTAGFAAPPPADAAIVSPTRTHLALDGSAPLADDGGLPPEDGDGLDLAPRGEALDLAGVGGSLDLANPGQPPDNSDMSLAPMPMSGPTVVDLQPQNGPAGTVLTVAGAGFVMGDEVVLSGSKFPATVLATLALVGGAITALVPAQIPWAPPASLTVSVRRGGAAFPNGGLPFALTAGTLHYLSPSGDDAAAGTLAAPWKTIAGAAGRMRPGDLAYLRGGIYSGVISLHASGAAGAPLTFTSYPGESALLTTPANGGGDTLSIYGSYLTFDHLRFTDAHDPGQAMAIVAGFHDVTISNCEVFGSRGQGITVSGDRNFVWRNHIHDNGSHSQLDHGMYIVGGGNVVRGNVIHDNWAYGIQLYDGDGGVHAGNTIEYNFIYHNGYGSTSLGHLYNAGLIIALGHPNSVVRYNRLCANAQFGLMMSDSEPGAQIFGNVFCYNGIGGIYLLAPGSGNSISGNISYNDGQFTLASSSGVASDKNTWFAVGGAPVLRWNGTAMGLGAFQQASGQEAHSHMADPQFANLPANGFSVANVASYDFCTPFVPQLCAATP